MAQPPILTGLSARTYLENLQRMNAEADAQQVAGLRALAPEVDPTITLGVDRSNPLAEGSRAGFVRKGLATGAANLSAGGEAIKGLARYALGDNEAAARNIAAAREYEEAAQRGGNPIRSIDQIDGVGDALSYAGNLAVEQIPSLPMLVLGGGVGGAALKGAARRGLTAAVERAATGAVDTAATSVARTGAERVARREAIERATDVALPDALATGHATMQRAATVGEALGATTAGLPLTATSTLGAVTDPNGEGTMQERAVKALAGTTAASAIGALPIVRLLNRTGLGGAVEAPVKDEAGHLLKGVLREAGTQGAVQGAAGAAQQAIALATHKWVNDNVDLADGAAMQQYLEGLVGGAVGGALLGGVFEGGMGSARSLGGAGAKAGEAGATLTGGARAAVQEGRKQLKAFREKFGRERAPVPADGSPAPAPEGTPTADVPDPLAAALGELATVTGERVGTVVDDLKAKVASTDFKATNEKIFATIDRLRAQMEAATPEVKAKITDAVRALTNRLRGDEDEIVMSSGDPEVDEFNRHDGELKADDDFDEMLTSAAARLQNDDFVPTQRAPNQNPVQFENGLQNVLATHIDANSPLWAFHGEVLKPMLDSVERVFRNDYGTDDAATAQRKADGEAFDHYLALVPPEARQTVELQAARFNEISDLYNKARKASDEIGDDTPAADPDLLDTPDNIDEPIEVDDGSDAIADGAEDSAGTGYQDRTGTEDARAVADGIRPEAIRRTGFIGDRRPDAAGGERRVSDTVVRARDGDELGVLDLNYLTSERLKLNRNEADTGRANIIRSFQDGLGDAYLAGIRIRTRDLSPDTVIFRSQDGKQIVKLGEAGARAAKAIVRGERVTERGRAIGPEILRTNDTMAPTRAERGLPRTFATEGTRTRTVVEKTGNDTKTATGVRFVDRDTTEVVKRGKGNRTRTEPYVHNEDFDTGGKREGVIIDSEAADRPTKAMDEAAAKLPKVPPPKASDPRVANASPIAAVRERPVPTKDITSRQKNPRSAVENARAEVEARIAKNAVARATDSVRAALPENLRTKLDALKAAIDGKPNRIAAQATAEGRALLEADIQRGRGAAKEKQTLKDRITDAQAKERGLQEFSRRLINQAPSLRGRVDTAIAKAAETDRAYVTTLRKVGKDSLVQAAQKLRDAGQLSDAAYARRVKRINEDLELQRREGLRVADRPEDTAGVEVVHQRRDAETIDKEAARREVGNANIVRPGDSVEVTDPAERGRKLAAKKAREDAALAKEKKDAANAKRKETIAAKKAKEELKADDDATSADIEAGFREVKKTSKHDTAKETRMANAVLRDLGIDVGVTIKSMSELPAGLRSNSGNKQPGQGAYHYGYNTIYIGDHVTGAERVEVIFHELGHHIFTHEYAKAAPEIKAAIDADYQKWRAEREASTGESVADILASRKPAARAAGILRRADGTTPDLLNDNQRSYLYDREEFIADQLARALSSNKKTQATVSRFFVVLADKLKALYEKVFGNPKYAQYKPAPSVEAWVQSLFDRQTIAASRAMERPLSSRQAEITTAAALRVLHGEGDDPARSNAEDAGSPGAGKPPPPDGNGGGRGEGADGEGTGADGPDPYFAVRDFMAEVLTPAERVILERVLARSATENALRKTLTPEQAAELDAPETRQLALLARSFEKWASGEFKIASQGEDIFARTIDAFHKIAGTLGDTAYAERIFDDILNGRIERAKARGKTYDAREVASRGKGRIQQIKRVVETTIEKKFTPAVDAVLKGMGERLRTMGVPAAGEMVARIERDTGEHGKAGYNLRTVRKYNEFQRRFSDAVDGLSTKQTSHVLRRLQRQDFTPSKNAAITAAMTKLQDVFDKAHTYGSEVLNLGVQEKFFPVVMDSAKVMKNEAAFRAFMLQPHLEAGMRRHLATLAERKGNKAYAAGILSGSVKTEKLVDILFRMASRAEELGDNPDSIAGNGASPAFQSGRARVMQFVYDVGTDADKRQFARWQSNNLHEILGTYSKQITRRTEFARQFGLKGEGVAELLEKAAKQGASPEQVQLMRDYLDMNTGNYGSAFSPTLKKMLGKVDKVFGTKLAEIDDKSGKGKFVINALTAYQNARVLPLATLASLGDPLGIFVRSGGEVGSSFKAVREGIQQMVKGGDLVNLGNMLGLLDEHMIQDSLAAANNASMTGPIGKLNNFVFKWNGLAGLTKTTRVMALSAGQTFLLKHAALAKKGDAKSAAYLKELGIKPDDVMESDPGRVKVLNDAERDAADQATLDRDERVRDALTRFMDESILRPTASQRPGWHSDPYFNLVSQYKGYLYAFHNKVVKRAMLEAGRGNPRVLLPLLAYVPVALSAEVLREFANYGPDGNPRRENWGTGEYLQLAAMKSGLPTPRATYVENVISDPKYGRTPGTSLIGPTLQQGVEVADAFTGGQPISSVVEESLPAGSVLQHWL